MLATERFWILTTVLAAEDPVTSPPSVNGKPARKVKTPSGVISKKIGLYDLTGMRVSAIRPPAMSG